MHSSQPLVADLAPLPKKSGDSGDKSKSRRLGNDLEVTTLRVSASSLTNQVVPPSKSSGDVKRNTSQSPNKGVTTVTSVTTNLQKRWSALPGTNTPPEWRANLDRPRESNPVRGFSVERWQTRIVDGENFLTSWGERALQFGWADLDLFGAQPKAPAFRFDVMGLIPIIGGGEVVSLTERSATIQTPVGSRLVYLQLGALGGV
jgi:hypothetical protein